MAPRNRVHNIHKSSSPTRSGGTGGSATDQFEDRPDVRTASERRYEHWSRQELYERAKELGIAGRSTMDKEQLIEAIQTLDQRVL